MLGGREFEILASEATHSPRKKVRFKPTLCCSRMLHEIKITAAATTRHRPRRSTKNSSRCAALHDTVPSLQRFPVCGTPDFDEKCPWTSNAKQNNNNSYCTLFRELGQGGNEGLSHWTSHLATGVMLARQTGCRFCLTVEAQWTLLKLLHLQTKMLTRYNAFRIHL